MNLLLHSRLTAVNAIAEGLHIVLDELNVVHTARGEPLNLESGVFVEAVVLLGGPEVLL